MVKMYIEQRDELLLYWKELCISRPKCNIVELRSEVSAMYSYQLWAIETALEQVNMNEDILPISIVEAFANLTDKYSTYHNEKAWAYSVAYDTLMDVLGRMYALYEQKEVTCLRN